MNETATPDAPETDTPDLGYIFILEELYPEPVDGGSGPGGPITPTEPPRPPARRGHGGNDNFWKGIAWAFLLLLAFATGGAIGEIGQRLGITPSSWRRED